MRKMSKKLGVLLVILSMTFGILAAGCSQVGKKYGDTKGLFWEVKKGQATVYMLASIHLGEKSLYPMQQNIEDAFDSSNIVVGEIDTTKVAGNPELKTGTEYQDGEIVMDHLSPEGKEKVDKLCKDIGLDKGKLPNLRLWEFGAVLSAAISQKAGYSPDLGIDQHFLNRARTDGKKIQELEGIKFQMDLLNGFSDKELEDNFILNLKDVTGTKKDLDTMFGFYKTGDEEKFTELFLQSMDRTSNYYKKTVLDRNTGMTNKIEEYLNTKNTYFVIAGAAHFVGEDGIIKMLKDKGFTVTKK